MPDTQERSFASFYYMLFLSNLLALTLALSSGASHEEGLAQVIGKMVERIAFSEPRLLQVQYDSYFEPTYTVSTVKAPVEVGKHPSRESWTVLFKPGSSGVRVSVRGGSPAFPRSKADRSRNHAVLVAMRKLTESGQLSLPCVVSASRSAKSWSIRFSRVPVVTGGDVLVSVAGDFRSTSVFHGD